MQPTPGGKRAACGAHGKRRAFQKVDTVSLRTKTTSGRELYGLAEEAVNQARAAKASATTRAACSVSAHQAELSSAFCVTSEARVRQR
jgi:hypothetical protein